MRIVTTALAALVIAAAPAAAQDYPAGPITIVVPFGPGSGSDIHARLIAKHFTQSWRQPVVIDNKPGANGAIAGRFAAAAKPDGYTLFVGSATTQAVNPPLYGDKLGYDAAAMAPVGMLGAGPIVLAIDAKLEIATLAELAAKAKAAPGKLACGAGNAVMQTACHLLARRVGAEIVVTNYRSNPQALTDAAGGHIAMAFADTASARAIVDGGKVRVLGISGRQAMPQFPGVPLFREAGYPDLDLTAWAVLMVPAGTPEPIQARLNEELRRIYAGGEARELIARAGGFAMPLDLAGTRAFVAEEAARWRRFVAETGIKPE